MRSGFETPSVTMQPMLLVTVQAPAADVERIMMVATAITPLTMGAYDGNAFQTGPGTERYRPPEGAAAGAEASLRHRPGVIEVRFELPDDQDLLEQVAEVVPGPQLSGAGDPSLIDSRQPIEGPR